MNFCYISKESLSVMIGNLIVYTYSFKKNIDFVSHCHHYFPQDFLHLGLILDDQFSL